MMFSGEGGTWWGGESILKKPGCFVPRVELEHQCFGGARHCIDGDFRSLGYEGTKFRSFSGLPLEATEANRSEQKWKCFNELKICDAEIGGDTLVICITCQGRHVVTPFGVLYLCSKRRRLKA